MKTNRIVFQFVDLIVYYFVFFITLEIRSVSNLFIFDDVLVYTVTPETVFYFALSGFLYIFGLYITGQYEYKLKISFFNVFLTGFTVSFIVFSFLLMIPYLFELTPPPRSFILTFLVLNLVLWFVVRVIYTSISKKTVHRVAVIGRYDESYRMLKLLRSFHDFPIEIIGTVLPAEADCPENDRVYIYPFLGNLDNLNRITQNHKIDVVIIASSAMEIKQSVIDIIDYSSYKTTSYFIVPSNYEIILSVPEYLRIHDFPLIKINKVNHYLMPVKRFFDVVFAFFLSVLLMPLMLLTACIVKLTSKGPVLFVQTRIGKGQRQFKMYKFRTMYIDYESEIYKAKRGGDKRLTPVGKWLRKSRIDELPQLINIMKGDMSFIGPRPLVEKEVHQGVESVHGYKERFAVTPGVTGLAQVHGDYYTNASVKIKYDLWYVFHYSLKLDLVILFRTLKTVVLRQGS